MYVSVKYIAMTNEKWYIQNSLFLLLFCYASVKQQRSYEYRLYIYIYISIYIYIKTYAHIWNNLVRNIFIRCVFSLGFSRVINTMWNCQPTIKYDHYANLDFQRLPRTAKSNIYGLKSIIGTLAVFHSAVEASKDQKGKTYLSLSWWFICFKRFKQ